MDLKRVYSIESRSDTAKSSCDGSAPKAMRRATLRELMQLPLDRGTSEHLEPQESTWKCVKGISWSSLFKPRDTGNNKPQRNDNRGVFAKLTKLWRKYQTPQSEKKMNQSPGSENVRPELKTSFGVEHDDEHSCKNSSDEKHDIEENDGDKAGRKTSSFDTHKVEEPAMKNLQHTDSTNLDLLFGDHMLAKSSDGGFAEKSSPRNASCAEYGSPIQNAAAELMSQSKIWEYFELIDVWTAQEETMKKQAAAEEERLKKQEAVAKEYKWILNGDKGRPWSSSSDRDHKQHQTRSYTGRLLPRNLQRLCIQSHKGSSKSEGGNCMK